MTIASATTDPTGFYYFADTARFTSGSSYTVKVSAFPSGPRTSTPTSQKFTWQGMLVGLSSFSVY